MARPWRSCLWETHLQIPIREKGKRRKLRLPRRSPTGTPEDQVGTEERVEAEELEDPEKLAEVETLVETEAMWAEENPG